MNKEQRKFRKITKGYKRRKDFVKKRNILKQYLSEMENLGLKVHSMRQPIKFPERKKYK